MRVISFLTYVFILVTMTAFTACSDQGREANIGPEERPDRRGAAANVNNINSTTVAANATVADVMGNPNNYIGRMVTVNGWVERGYGTNSFRLDEDSVFTGGIDNDLLVVGASGGIVPAGLKSGTVDARVRVTGTVQRMVVAEIERDYGVDLDTEVETEFRDKPVLVAKSVQVLENNE